MAASVRKTDFSPINRLLRPNPETENGRAPASFARSFLPVAFPFSPAIVVAAV